MSDREFRVWKWYFGTRLNRPGLTDHHLMQIGSLIASFLCRQPVPMEDMRLKFDDEGDIEELTEEELLAKAKEVSEMRRQMLIAQNRKGHHGG